MVATQFSRPPLLLFTLSFEVPALTATIKVRLTHRAAPKNAPHLVFRLDTV